MKTMKNVTSKKMKTFEEFKKNGKITIYSESSLDATKRELRKLSYSIGRGTSYSYSKLDKAKKKENRRIEREMREYYR
jgi:hypothetical protein